VYRLACIQLQIDEQCCTSRTRFQNWIEAPLQRLRSRYQDEPIYAFYPEHIGSFTIFSGSNQIALEGAETLEQAAAALIKRSLPRVLWARLYRAPQGWMPALAAVHRDIFQEVYWEGMAAAAKKYGLWIAAGSCLWPDFKTRGVYNQSWLFDPKGRAVDTQQKVHLVELEGSRGFQLKEAPTAKIHRWDSAPIPTAAAICLDTFHDDVISQLSGGSPAILYQPSANMGPWSPWQQEDWMRGCHRRVWEQQLFPMGINPMLTGSFLDLTFEGQSSIASASEYTRRGYLDMPSDPGFAAVSCRYSGDDILVASAPQAME